MKRSAGACADCHDARGRRPAVADQRTGYQSSAIRHAHRTAGQVAALAAMLDEGKPFSSVAQQILAARGSLDGLLLRVLEDALRACVPADPQRGEVVRLLQAAVGQSGLPTVLAPTFEFGEEIGPPLAAIPHR